MSGKTFEGQVARMGWVPGAEPRPALVEAILNQHGKAARRDIMPTLLGVMLGALIGVLLKGMAMPEAPWGPESGWVGLVVGTIALLGLAGAICGALLSACVSRRHPALMQFTSINLLTLLIVVFV